MKKIIRMLFAVIISVVIVATLPVSVFAYEYGELNLEDMIQVKKVGEKEITSISASDVNRIRISKSKAYSDKTDEERMSEIFEALGVNMNERQKEEIKSMLSLSDIGSMQVSTAYLEINEYGKQVEISKEQALSEIAVDSNLQTTSTYSKSGGTETTKTHTSPVEKDGIMEQQMLIIYTPHYDGIGTTPNRYVFIGFCNWLSPPVNRRTDCIAFLSSDFRWNNKGIDDNEIDDNDTEEIANYNLLVSYTLTEVRNGEVYLQDSFSESFSEEDVDVSTFSGAFFEYNLKNDVFTITSQTTYSDLSFMMSAVGKTVLNYEIVESVAVDFVYTHAITSLALNIDYAWGSSGENANIVSSFSTTTKKYTHYFTWSYKDDYNEFFG